MGTKPVVCVVAGTRPEVIKLAPVIQTLRNSPSLACHFLLTAQHRQMVDQALDVFGIRPDKDLDLMKSGQSLGAFTADALSAIDSQFQRNRPDLVLVQGDTTTVFAAALTAFYHRIPVGHVEAGLRTHNLQSPWPEEANRVMTSKLTKLHFAPTEYARDNLLREGITESSVFVTGNTVIDALLWVRDRLERQPASVANAINALGLPEDFSRRFIFSDNQSINPLILITGHRRESFGTGFENICKSILALAEQHPHIGIIYPVHLNPNVQRPVRRALGGHPRIKLVEPLSYEPFVWLMNRAYFVLSDSGGIQEEAPSLGKPVLVMRETTERPEGIEAGTSILVGTTPSTILQEASILLNDSDEYRRRCRLKNPYGDGTAAGKIVRQCEEFLTSQRATT